MIKEFLSYLIVAVSCCGFFVYQIYTPTLNDFSPHHPQVDNSTFGNVDEVQTQHYHLELQVNFETQSIVGFNTIDLFTASFTDKVVLDIEDLDIFFVEYLVPGSAKQAGNGGQVVPIVQL